MAEEGWKHGRLINICNYVFSVREVKICCQILSKPFFTTLTVVCGKLTPSRKTSLYLLHSFAFISVMNSLFLRRKAPLLQGLERFHIAIV